MAGYSGTPLAKKLGIKPGATIYLDGAPDDYPSEGAKVVKSIRDRVDLIHLFTKSAAELDAKLRRYRERIRDDAAVWVSWPKKASKVPPTSPTTSSATSPCPWDSSTSKYVRSITCGPD